MKNVKKITRLRLENSQPDEFIFLGLVSSEPDYKLSLFLNKKLRISLKNTLPLIVPGNTGDLQFSRFSIADNDTGLSFTLISNRSGKESLLMKLKNVDYLFVVHDPENEIGETLASNIREAESVTAVFNIDPDSIKDRNFQYLIH